jgi:putative Mn2+ efflux pump MntP
MENYIGFVILFGVGFLMFLFGLWYEKEKGQRDE